MRPQHAEIFLSEVSAHSLLWLQRTGAETSSQGETMNEQQLAQVGRIAFRQQGDWWVAYYAPPDTMTNAIELARVGMGFVQTGERRRQFIQFVRDIYADAIEEKIGVRPEFPTEPQPAPEHERSGCA